MNKIYPFSALAVAIAVTLPAVADNKLEEIIVTSSRVAMPLRSIGTSVSVISAEAIEQRGFNSLFDVLRSEPAVAVSNSGGAGKQTALRIRGEEGYRTLVLLDGIDVSNAAGTQVGPRIEHILSSGIQRVEILRGPQGLMYGADAGGVVNITSRAPADGFGGQLSAEAGGHDTQQLVGNIGASGEAMDFVISAADFHTGGFNARTTDTVLRDDDGYDNTTVHGKLGWDASEALRFELVGRNVSSESEFDGCASPVDFAASDVCHSDYDQSAWRASMEYSTAAFTHQLSYSGNDTESESFTDGLSAFGSQGELQRLSYVGSFSTDDTLRLVYGADFEQQSLDDGFFDTERDQDALFAEYQGGFGERLFLTAGLRYDDNEDFGSHTSYRLSGAYLLALAGGELKLRGAYGTGFRPPSLYEIAYNNSGIAYPPASEVELEEERSKGYDLGVSWSADSGIYLEAVYFDQDIEDEIYYDLVAYSGYLQTGGNSNSKGIELIAEWPVTDDLWLSGNYTYNETDTADGAPRVRRPEQLVNLGINWQLLAGRVVLGLNARGSYDAIDNDGSDLDDYTVVDINASFELVRGVELYGRVENLFDEDYEEIPTYNTSETVGYAGVRWSF